MQNGSVTRNYYLRSVGHIDSANWLHLRHSVRGFGVRTVRERTLAPQIGSTGWRSIADSPVHERPTPETRFSTLRW